MSQSTLVSEVARRDVDLDEAVDGLLDDIFVCLRSTELQFTSRLEPRSTELFEDDGVNDWDWADDRPTPELRYAPPPAPPPGCVWMAGAHRLRV
jgi:hypothetical protein